MSTVTFAKASGLIADPIIPDREAPNDENKPELAQIVNGKLDFRPHPGQWRAWESTRRFILVLAGTQGGKTSFGPHWLMREITRCGPGDYLIVTPTFQLLEKKALPEFRKVFERWFKLGTYLASPSRRFLFSEEGQTRLWGKASDTPTQVWFGYAEDPESLESATVKAAWLDEAGQKKFRLDSWYAIRRRLSLARGRALITTTPYDLGWLKQILWNAHRDGDPNIDVVRFDSTENPQFSAEEFLEAKRSLPAWKFDLFYRGIFTQPAGSIYDSFRDDMYPRGHKVKRFPIPSFWPRYLGLDFGGVNTAAIYYAQEVLGGRSTGRFYLYRTYKAGRRTAKEHVKFLKQDEPGFRLVAGGSKSEDQWRAEFKQAGLPVADPIIKDVEVGIDRVYGMHKRNELLVFDDLDEYLDEKVSYSREMDEYGNVTEDIEDKNKFHLMDAERYLVSLLKQGKAFASVAGGRRPQVSPVGGFAGKGFMGGLR